jgi:hypothetical protein
VRECHVHTCLFDVSALGRRVTEHEAISSCAQSAVVGFPQPDILGMMTADLARGVLHEHALLP